MVHTNNNSIIAMSSQICLKWNSFLNNIATSFESLWEEEGLVDVTLASDGQCLTAHKVILSASSPFFKKVFQTNPCQHPVIILQDVHFSELEALLIFIYKGEVNIEQENLPALLKAAETLQIRGLSGGDIFAKESHKKFTTSELDHHETNEMINIVDETSPKKKQKISKTQNHSILEKALTPRKIRSSSGSESSNSDRSSKDNDGCSDSISNVIDHPLEMKIEPFEVTVEELQNHVKNDKEQLERLDTGQTAEVQGTSTSSFPTTSYTASSSMTPSLNTSGYSTPLDNNYSQCINSESSITSATTRHSVIATNICDDLIQPMHSINNNASYPPFPCPFCERAYTSWGFRRRHIKAVHTISPELNCKWCMEILPTHAAWRRHVVSAHNLSASDAHNGLLILEEAHMVLQFAHPTRLDALVNIIKHNSSQSQ